MFGVSFTELALVFVVALIVLGPKRLPGLVRKVGRWVGKARSMAREFQNQLENEINLDELNRMTETTAQQAQATQPAPPTEFSGDLPAVEVGPSANADEGNLAAGGYPYGRQEPTPEPASASEPVPETSSGSASDTTLEPQPGDDTYSHAHAQGELPLADEPAASPDTEHKKDNAAA